MPRNFVGEPFSVSLFSAAEKVWIREGVKYHDFLSKIICLTVRINSVGGANPLAFHSFRASIKFGQVGGGVPSKIFCLTVPKQFVREPRRVSLISGMEKFFASEGYVTIFEFVSKFFCLTVPRKFVEKPFSVSLLSGAEEVWIREGVKYHDFPSKIICLTVPKKFLREPFRVSLTSGVEKCFASVVMSRFSVCCPLFRLTVPKNFVGEPFCAVI